MKSSFNFRVVFAAATLASLLMLSGCKAPDLMPPGEDSVEPQPTGASADTGAEDSANINLDDVFEEEEVTPPTVPS